MNNTERGRAYSYRTNLPSHSQSYLKSKLDYYIARDKWPTQPSALDYGCGNGWFANHLACQGFNVTGVDISQSGIDVASRSFCAVTFSSDVSDENLVRTGPFHLVTCIEVIAHCYRPIDELTRLYNCLAPGGRLILSTPYHGYWKYLALATTGRLESYLDTAWGGAYLHHFSERTIRQLLQNVGFKEIEITRAGRISPLAKAMIVVCQKAAS